MITRKLLLVFGLFFILNGTKTIRAQSTVPIVLNEYCVSNVPAGFGDDKGALNDYVELYNNHTADINLSSFYLSNDRNNLAKWRFPASYPVMKPGDYNLVWLSGKNSNNGASYHANFTIDQCKNQWIILSNSAGVVYDSVFVQATKAGHVRGRVDLDNVGINGWRIYKSKTPYSANGAPDATAYAPKPVIVVSTINSVTGNTNVGGFLPEPGQIAYIKLNNMTFDTAYSCYDIFYTINGDFPIPGYPVPPVGTLRYTDSTNSSIALEKTLMIRAIAVPNPTKSCNTGVMQSFCETNTYFVDPEYNAFDSNFGVLSIALDKADQGWFNAQGTPAATVHVEYYDKKVQMSEGYAVINRPPQEEWRTAQKGFYISKDDRLGFGCNFEGNVFNVEGLGTTPRRVFPTLHLKGGDYESHSTPGFTTGVSYGTGVRDVVMQSLAAKYDLKVSPLHIKPVITFVNGEYWGVYDLREVYDKYYENYYNGQSMDSLDLKYVHNNQESVVSYWDGSSSNFGQSFNTQVYNTVVTKSMRGTVSSNSDFKKVMDNLDKESLIDYMILNTYGMNSDLWANNVTLARGGQTFKKGGKWHFYLWNTPSVFNFTKISPSGNSYNNVTLSPCYIYSTFNYPLTTNFYNSHGKIMKRFFDGSNGNTGFQKEYINRYLDLMNGPLKCDNILKQFDYVYNLFLKEMKYHEDPTATPFPGEFVTLVDTWDTNMLALRKVIQNRCYHMEANAFDDKGCYGLAGPFPISVDVTPEGAGKVKLNSVILDTYTWYGNYYQTTLSFKAIPTNTTDYKFHHWEFPEGPVPTDPLSLDSVGMNFNRAGRVVAVFTDKRNDIANSGENANLPTGFTPNGDLWNDDFKPLGSGEFAQDYQMTVWNRWGQEVFRSIDPLVGWDGRYKGQEAQTGVYAYVITYKNVYLESKMVKGNVTLTR